MLFSALGSDILSVSLRAHPSNVECSFVEDFVFCFDETTGVVLSSHVLQFQVPRQRRKERDSFSDQYWYSCDGEALNETGTEKTLDRYPAVDVGVLKSSRR